MPTKLNRRQFLIRAAAGVGTATLTCGGITALVLPSGLHAPVDPSYEHLYSGENTMNQKILVTYASRAGSTLEVAQAVARELSNRGFAVDIRPVKQVSQLNDYSAVVVGSAVRMGQWLPDAVKFVEQNASALRNVPTAFFAVHLMNIENDETSSKARTAYLDSVRKLVSPHYEAFFAGVGDMSKVSFIEGLICKMVKSPEGDFRDWKAISDWSQSIFTTN